MLFVRSAKRRAEFVRNFRLLAPFVVAVVVLVGFSVLMILYGEDRASFCVQAFYACTICCSDSMRARAHTTNL